LLDPGAVPDNQVPNATVTQYDGRSRPIAACWRSWIAVHGANQADLVAQPALRNVRETTWAGGVDLIDEDAHSGCERDQRAGHPTTQDHLRQGQID
jgi:hypothetical protein